MLNAQQHVRHRPTTHAIVGLTTRHDASIVGLTKRHVPNVFHPQLFSLSSLPFDPLCLLTISLLPADTSAAFRLRLTDSRASFDSLIYVGSKVAADGTRKVLFRLPDELGGDSAGLIETVLIPHTTHRLPRGRATLSARDSAAHQQSLTPEAEKVGGDCSELSNVHQGGESTLSESSGNTLPMNKGALSEMGAPHREGTWSGRHSSGDTLPMRDMGDALPMTSIAGSSSSSNLGCRADSSASQTASANEAATTNQKPNLAEQQKPQPEQDLGGASGVHRRYTICVSSQLGCAMGCQFCYTAE